MVDIRHVFHKVIISNIFSEVNLVALQVSFCWSIKINFNETLCDADLESFFCIMYLLVFFCIYLYQMIQVEELIIHIFADAITLGSINLIAQNQDFCMYE